MNESHESKAAARLISVTVRTVIMMEVERLLDSLPDYGSAGFEVTMHDGHVVGIKQSRTKSIRAGEAA